MLVNLENNPPLKMSGEAARALGFIAPKIQRKAVLGPAIPLLIQAIGDQMTNVRTNSVWALGQIASKGDDEPILKSALPAAIPSLIEALQYEPAQIRGWAAWVLQVIAAGVQDEGMLKPLLPALMQTTQDESENVRRQATWALGEVISKVHDGHFCISPRKGTLREWETPTPRCKPVSQEP